MNKLKFPILLCACAALAVSCEDNLDEPQKGVTAYENFYKTDADAEGALVAMYATYCENIARPNNEAIICPYIALYNLPGDDLYAAGEFYGDNDFNGEIDEFREGTNAQLVTSMYKGFYQIIYGANLVICNLDADSQVKKRCIAEARVMRAFAHMMLAIGWNNPPKVDQLLGGDAQPVNCDHNELLQWCADECLASVADLDERQSTSDKNGTAKITKGFANFVAGKALVFKGDYAAAKAPLKAIISSGKYALVPTERIRETFHVAGEGNEEVIFAGNVQPNPAIGDWNGMIQKTTWMHMDIWGWRNDHWNGKPSSVKGGWGGLGVREEFAAEFVANEGDSPRRKAWILKYDPEILYEMEYPGDTVGGSKGFTNEQKSTLDDRGIRTYTYGQSEYLMYKRLTDNSDMTSWFSHLNVLIARYAEVLLLYAEACAQTGDNDGLQYLQAIQTRAGAPVSGSLTLDAVKKEKKFEMFLEGCRFPDMVRWGDAATSEILKHSGDKVPYLFDAKYDANGNADGVGTTEAKHRIYLDYKSHNEGKEHGFKVGKHEYFPFPFAETSINKAIQQNQGW